MLLTNQTRALAGTHRRPLARPPPPPPDPPVRPRRRRDHQSQLAQLDGGYADAKRVRELQQRRRLARQARKKAEREMSARTAALHQVIETMGNEELVLRLRAKGVAADDAERAYFERDALGTALVELCLAAGEMPVGGRLPLPEMVAAAPGGGDASGRAGDGGDGREGGGGDAVGADDDAAWSAAGRSPPWSPLSASSSRPHSREDRAAEMMTGVGRGVVDGTIIDDGQPEAGTRAETPAGDPGP